MWDLEDLDGITRCILWPEQFAQFGELVAPDAIVAVRGKVDRRPGAEETNLIVDELIPLTELPERYSSGIVIRVREQDHGERGLEQLREILRGYPGSKKLKLRLDLATGAQVWLDSGWSGVELNPEVRTRVEGLLGAGSFAVQAKRPAVTEARRRQPMRA
jgi:DNA polymerase-3 subunit alpha